MPESTKASYVEAFDVWRRKTSKELNLPCELPTTKDALARLKIDYLNEYFISKVVGVNGDVGGYPWYQGRPVGSNDQPSWFSSFLAVVIEHVIDLASKETVEANIDSEHPE